MHPEYNYFDMIEIGKPLYSTAMKVVLRNSREFGKEFVFELQRYGVEGARAKRRLIYA